MEPVTYYIKISHEDNKTYAYAKDSLVHTAEGTDTKAILECAEALKPWKELRETLEEFNRF